MSNATTRVFVSATTRDLGSYRNVTKDALLKADIHPIVQEDFPHDYRTVAGMLEERIRTCDAVICLIGFSFGAAPVGGDVRRSYTQIEYDIAQRLSKPTFLFVAADALNERYGDTEVDRQRQQAHREALIQGDQLYRWFSRMDELRLSISELVPQLHALRAARRKPLQGVGLPIVPLVFVGRHQELAQLSEAIERNSPSVVAVVGLGGQGKTTLLMHYLRSLRTQSFTAAFWCTATDGMTFELFLEDALQYFLGVEGVERHWDTSARIRRLIRYLQQERALLVLDQVERWFTGWSGDSSPASSVGGDRRASATDLGKLLSEATAISSGSHVVLTTRALPTVLETAAVALIPVDEPRRRFELDGLDDNAAVELLQRLGVQGEPVALLETAHDFANHPLALTVVGTQLARRFGGRLAKLVHTQALDPNQRLFALFEETRRHLPDGPESERLLQVASCCLEDPSLLTLAAATHAHATARSWFAWALRRSEGTAAREALVTALRDRAIALADWHLAEWNGETETLRLHPLIKQFFSQGTRDAGAIHLALADWYCEQEIPESPTTLDDVRPRILAVEHTLRAAESQRAVDLFFSPASRDVSLAQWLVTHGYLSRDLIDRLLREVTGRPRADLLTTRAAMSRLLGDLEVALRDSSEAVTLLDTDVAADGGRLAGALVNRGNVYRQLARYEEAVVDFNRAVDILGTVDSGQLALTYLNRAAVLHDSGHFQRALSDCGVAVSLSAATNDHLLLADAQVARANVLADSGAFDAAVSEYDSAIAVYAQLHETGRHDVVARLAEVTIARASTANDDGRPHDALRDLNTSIATLRKLAGRGRPELLPAVALGLLARAKAQAAVDRWPEAIGDAEAAVTLYRRLTADGRHDLNGYLAHSLLCAAYVQVHSDTSDTASQLLHQGLTLASATIRRGQTDVRIPLVRMTALLVLSLLPSQPTQAVVLLNTVCEEVEAAFGCGDWSEALVFELAKAFERLDNSWPTLEKSGFDPSRIVRLRSYLANQ